MNNETWKQINDYPDYFISNTGKVRNIKSGRELQQILNRQGYLVINLHNNKKMKQFYVHRLVAQAFIPNPDNLDTVDHINGLKTDNRTENLQWLSNSDNIKKFHKEQATEDWKRKNKNNGFTPRAVICLETGKIFESTRSASRETGIPDAQIVRLCKGKIKNTHSLHFEYLF